MPASRRRFTTRSCTMSAEGIEPLRPGTLGAGERGAEAAGPSPIVGLAIGDPDDVAHLGERDIHGRWSRKASSNLRSLHGGKSGRGTTGVKLGTAATCCQQPCGKPGKGSSGFAGGVEILGVDGLEEGTETGDLGLFVLVLQLDPASSSTDGIRRSAPRCVRRGRWRHSDATTPADLVASLSSTRSAK